MKIRGYIRDIGITPDLVDVSTRDGRQFMNTGRGRIDLDIDYSSFDGVPPMGEVEIEITEVV